MKEKSNQESLPILVDVGKPKRSKNAKLTPKIREKFLKEFAKDLNMSRASRAVGVSRQAIQQLIKRDERFRNAFQEIKDAYLDSIESACVAVALQPTREGFNDRKLMLQSHRPETYAPQLKINQKVSVDARVINANLADLIQRFLPSAEVERKGKE